jgi:hypothetical protein
MKSLILLLAPAAWASVILEPVPVITEVCTVAGNPVACGTSTLPAIYDDERVGTTTIFSISGFGTTDGITLEVGAEAAAGNSGQPDDLGSSALATISFDFLGSTDGPVRQGFATYFLATTHDHGASGGGGSSSFIEGLASCAMNCYAGDTLVPFGLGTSFNVGLFAFGSGGSGQHIFDGGGGYAFLQLRLFETDGTPVAIYDPPTAVPEPARFVLTGFALLGVLSMREAARRASPHK